VDRCALFVDASYMLADGAMAVHGTRHRDSVSWDYSGLLKFLAGLSRDRSGLPVLRCYWYEATVEGRRTPEHDTLADLAGLKLRLGRMRPGRREGVETEIHRDLTTLARNGAISDAIVVSGEEDLAEVVAEVQDLGIRVILLHITVDGNWTVSRPLRQECDEILEIGSAHLRPFVDLIPGAEPARHGDEYPASAYSGRSLANGHGSVMPAVTHRGLPAAALPAPPASYTAPVVTDYQQPELPGQPGGTPSGGTPPGQPGDGQPGQAQPAQAQPAQAQPAQPDGAQGQAGDLPGQPSSTRPAHAAGPEPGRLPQRQPGGAQGQAADLPGRQPASAQPGQPSGLQGQAGSVQQDQQPAGLHAQPGAHQGQPGGTQEQAGPTREQAGATRAESAGTRAESGGGPAGQPGSPGQPGRAQPDLPGGISVAGGSPASFGVPAPLSAPPGPAPGSGPPAAQRGDEPQSRSQGAPPYPPDPFLDRLPAPAADAAPGQQAGQPGGSQRRGMGGGRSYPPPDPYPPADLYPAAEQYPAGQYPAGQYPPGQYPPADGGQYGGGAGQLPPGQFSGPQHGQHGGALSPSFAVPQDGPYSGPQPAATQPPVPQPVAISLADAVQAAHAEGFGFGEAVARDAPALWLEAVLARKPRMPSDLEARLLQGSALPIDSLLHDEVRHALRRGFWDALERSRR
jgi:NYN domain